MVMLSAGARAVSMGSAYTAISGNPEAVFFNPAGTVGIKSISLNLFGTHLFNIKELPYSTVVLSLPIANGSAAVTFQDFGNNIFKETTVGLAWAGKITDYFFYGIHINRYQLYIKNYGSDKTIFINYGLIIKMSKNIIFGCAVKNLYFSNKLGQKKTLPFIINTGISCRMINNSIFCFDIVKEGDLKPAPRCGCELTFLPQIMIRFGVERNPPSFSTGIGIQYSNFFIDYGLRNHSFLGVTHLCGITISLGKN